MLRTECYEGLVLCDVVDDEPRDWPLQEDVSVVRASLPAGMWASSMADKGFSFADRTIGVRVPLRKGDDPSRHVRMDVRICGGEHDEELFSIARRGFLRDTRFHVTSDDRVSDAILRSWIGRMADRFVCFYKDMPVGFLELDCSDPDGPFVRLAAVEARYSATGAALSLYACAMQWVRDEGFSCIRGRVSSVNMPVVNLYAFLGGSFADPLDVFLKEL